MTKTLQLSSTNPTLPQKNYKYTPFASTPPRKQNMYRKNTLPYPQKKPISSTRNKQMSVTSVFHPVVIPFPPYFLGGNLFGLKKKKTNDNKSKISPVTVVADAGGSSKLHPPYVKPPARVATHQAVHLAAVR